MKNASFIGIFVVMVLAGMCGCTDMGSDVPQPASVPTITAIQPDSAFAGDTLKIIGTNFGATQGSSVVSVGGTIADTIYLWSATEIDVKVPASAVTGNVRVTVGGATSNAPAFKIRGAVVPASPSAMMSFRSFKARDAPAAMEATSNLYRRLISTLDAGNKRHGPVVTPGNGEGSVIIKKLRGTAGFGSQMPSADRLSPIQQSP